MNTGANEERVDITSHTTREVPGSQLLLSARHVSSDHADICVGFLGQPNVTARLAVGDYVCFSKSDAENYELRLLRLWQNIHSEWGVTTLRNTATIAIRAVPIGIFAGSETVALVNPPQATNDPFTPSDLERVQRAVTELKRAVRMLEPLPESLAEIDAHLDRMESAATKLGRRDWITLVLGTITNIVVVGVLGPEPARSLLALAGRLLTWCLAKTPTLP